MSNLASNSKETWRAIGGGREQHCIRFDRSDIEPRTSDFETNIVTATPISRLPIRHVDVRRPILTNSRDNSSMSNFTFCILYRKILVFAYIPSIVSCIYSSDGREVKSVCLLSCRLGFDSESGQTNDFKIGIHSFPA